MRFVALGDVENGAEQAQLAGLVLDRGAARLDPGEHAAAIDAEARIQEAGLLAAGEFFAQGQPILGDRSLDQLAQRERVTAHPKEARGLLGQLQLIGCWRPLDHADMGAVGGEAKMAFRACGVGLGQARALCALARDQRQHANGRERSRRQQCKAQQRAEPERRVVRRAAGDDDAQIAVPRERFRHRPGASVVFLDQRGAAGMPARAGKNQTLRTRACPLQRGGRVECCP